MNLRKKGFTIVELVIVIAVIAVLAAVLIPTFSNLIKKANESVDIQLVRNMNIILEQDEVTNGKPADIDKVKEILAKNGIVNPTPALAESTFAWDPEENLIVLINKETQVGVFPKQYEGVSFKPTWELLAGTVNVNIDNQTALKEAIMNATLDQTIVLNSDQTLSFSNGEKMPKNVNIDLNGHKLTLNSGVPMVANSNIYISNGVVENNNQITLPTGAYLSLDNVNYTSESGCAFYPLTSAQVDINGGKIIANNVIGTAYSDGKCRDIVVNISNATLGNEDNPCGVAIQMIASGDITINNCVIYADGIAVAQRCGNVTVKNTTIHYLRTEAYKDTFLGSDGTATSTPNGLKSQSWLGGIGDTTGGQVYVGPGIRAPFVVGDFRAYHYSYDANCVLENVTINKKDDSYPDVYLSQENYDILKDSDGTIVKGVDEVVKTNLTCDNSIKWVVNPGKNDSFIEYCTKDKEVFANYAGFYYSSSGFGKKTFAGTALHYVDNVYVNGVEQAPGSTSDNNIVAGNLSVNIPSFVGTFAAGEYDLSVLNEKYPSNEEYYDYTADVIQALKTDCGLELTREELLSAKLEFGSTPNALKFVTYTRDGVTDTKAVNGIDGRLYIDAISHLGLTRTNSGSVLANDPVYYLEIFKTVCEAHGIALTENSKIVVGANNTIIAVK